MVHWHQANSTHDADSIAVVPNQHHRLSFWREITQFFKDKFVASKQNGPCDTC